MTILKLIVIAIQLICAGVIFYCAYKILKDIKKT